MKKILMLLIVGSLSVSIISGCNADEKDIGNEQTVDASKVDDGDYKQYVSMEVDDVLDVIGNKERRFITLKNTSDYYLNGILKAYFKDEKGIILDSATVFFMNKEPGGFENELIDTPIAVEIESSEIEILRMEATEKPVRSPDITDENIYDYLYLKYDELNPKDTVYGQVIMSGDIYNLTTQYFSDTVTYVITDSDGNILEEEKQFYDNIKPGSKEPVVMGVDVADGYNVKYTITDYEFTD